jgi:hypothetical protein
MIRQGNSYLLWRGATIERGVDRVAKAAVKDWADALLEKANEHVPYMLGTLEDSGIAQVVQARNRGGLFSSGHEAIVSYDTPYAVHLHEHPEYNFQGKGEGKWLETALRKMAPSMERGLAPRFMYFFRSGL